MVDFPGVNRKSGAKEPGTGNREPNLNAREPGVLLPANASKRTSRPTLSLELAFILRTLGDHLERLGTSMHTF
jgi:hypothetical protein